MRQGRIMASISGSIEENAAAPKRVRGDSGEVEQHSLLDQIAADKYLASKAAVKSGFGFKMTKIASPGA